MDAVRTVDLLPRKQTVHPRSLKRSQLIVPTRFAAANGDKLQAPAKRACQAGFCGGLMQHIKTLFSKLGELFATLWEAITGGSGASEQPLPEFDVDKTKDALDKQLQGFFKDGIHPELRDYLGAREWDYEEVKEAFDLDTPEKEKFFVAQLIDEAKGQIDLVNEFRKNPDGVMDAVLVRMVQQSLIENLQSHPEYIEKLEKWGVDLEDINEDAFKSLRAKLPRVVMRQVENWIAPGVREAFMDDLKQIQDGNFKKFAVYGLINLTQKAEMAEDLWPNEGELPGQADGPSGREPVVKLPDGEGPQEQTGGQSPAGSEGGSAPQKPDGTPDVRNDGVGETGVRQEQAPQPAVGNPFGITGKNRVALVKAIRKHTDPASLPGAADQSGLFKACEVANTIVSMAKDPAGKEQLNRLLTTGDGQPLLTPDFVEALQRDPLTQNTAQRLVTLLKTHGDQVLEKIGKP